jgi:uncharacterized protein (TIGR03085 family)
MTYSRDERRTLCALLDEKGPGAPTLCEGWATRDLAAHLVIRERRPDAGLGMLGGPLAGYTSHVQKRFAERIPYPRLVDMVRSGPPRLSVFGLPGVDERGNLVEYFVHHEDVRRGEPGWQPRDLSSDESEALWGRLGMAKMILRRAPVGIELARDDVNGDARQHRMSVKTGTPVVTVVGHPGELVMWALGRTTAAQVRLDGADQAVEALNKTHWRL